MKKRNGGWTWYPKAKAGRQVLWFTVALSVASLVAVGITFSLESGRPGKHIDGELIKQLETVEFRVSNATMPVREVPSSHFVNVFNPNKDYFLVLKGIDTYQSACEYYRAIGAITERCRDLTPFGAEHFFFDPPEGIPVGIKLDCAPLAMSTEPCRDWKAEHGLKNRTHPVATYYNAVDLGFGRVMHGTTFTERGVTTTAYYVCNFLSRDGAIRAQGTEFGAVACVAFDYSTARGFTRLYVFKPFKRCCDLPDLFALAASAALDNAGEKFVPGLCKACHGSNAARDNPFTSFPGFGDNARTGNVGVKFLPFDLDNFDYGAGAFSRSAQEGAFKQLNDMLLTTAPRPEVIELLQGWYPGNRREQASDFIPEGWQGPGEQLYRTVVKPFCRTCHVAMFEALDFDSFDEFHSHRQRIATFVCSPSVGTTDSEERKMPHAAVTFDQFWNNRAAVAVLSRFLDQSLERRVPCPPPPP
jgi:hypothetical protein